MSYILWVSTHLFSQRNLNCLAIFTENTKEGREYRIEYFHLGIFHLFLQMTLYRWFEIALYPQEANYPLSKPVLLKETFPLAIMFLLSFFEQLGVYFNILLISLQYSFVPQVLRKMKPLKFSQTLSQQNYRISKTLGI